jgi:poly(3-hydroxybutyrate) depolymerase
MEVFMNQFFVATLMTLITSYAFADTPNLIGNWTLSNMVCSSNTPMKGGLKIGQDSMQAVFSADSGVQFISTVAGCPVKATGTYVFENNILNTTMTQSQSCKDADPVSMSELESFYVAHLDEKEMVAVVTGKNAAMVCPVNDALIFSFLRN